VTDGDGIQPPETAEKSLGDIVGDVSQKASLLVREEIELAKAEVQTKVKRLAKAIVVGAAAGVFVVFALSIFLHAFAWFFVDLFDFESIWPGFLIVTGVLLLLAAAAGLLAFRFVRTGAPPTPDLAIEEAKRTREAIEEVRR
jgi:H+/Cl- antiporter ClcA